MKFTLQINGALCPRKRRGRGRAQTARIKSQFHTLAQFTPSNQIKSPILLTLARVQSLNRTQWLSVYNNGEQQRHLNARSSATARSSMARTFNQRRNHRRLAVHRRRLRQPRRQKRGRPHGGGGVATQREKARRFPQRLAPTSQAQFPGQCPNS